MVTHNKCLQHSWYLPTDAMKAAASVSIHTHNFPQWELWCTWALYRTRMTATTYHHICSKHHCVCTQSTTRCSLQSLPFLQLQLCKMRKLAQTILHIHSTALPTAPTALPKAFTTKQPLLDLRNNTSFPSLYKPPLPSQAFTSHHCLPKPLQATTAFPSLYKPPLPSQVFTSHHCPPIDYAFALTL